MGLHLFKKYNNKEKEDSQKIFLNNINKKIKKKKKNKKNNKKYLIQVFK